MALMEQVAGAIYIFCVDFMINAAGILGVTYQDTNSLMFFILWPVVTATLSLVVVYQQLVLWRQRPAASGRSPASTPKPR